jgi:hypothetical protein
MYLCADVLYYGFQVAAEHLVDIHSRLRPPSLQWDSEGYKERMGRDVRENQNCVPSSTIPLVAYKSKRSQYSSVYINRVLAKEKMERYPLVLNGYILLT